MSGDIDFDSQMRLSFRVYSIKLGIIDCVDPLFLLVFDFCKEILFNVADIWIVLNILGTVLIILALCMIGAADGSVSVIDSLIQLRVLRFPQFSGFLKSFSSFTEKFKQRTCICALKWWRHHSNDVKRPGNKVLVVTKYVDVKILYPPEEIFWQNSRWPFRAHMNSNMLQSTSCRSNLID